MATLSYPGVYVEEISSGVRPIAAASTSVPAFIGIAEKGPLQEAVKIFNFTDYQNRYGGFLNGSFLAHAVFQFFNNGGTQCYIVRVSGENPRTANIVLKDQGTTAQQSLTISAISPGVSGNKLAVVIANGTNDPGNEFRLSVYWQDKLTPLEKFENLSVVTSAPNFVETIVASSNYIKVNVNQANTNVQAGASRGADAPSLPLPAGRNRLRININGDGYQEVDISGGVGTGTDQVANLTTAANVAGAIRFVVRQLTKQRASTDQGAFLNFQCTVDNEQDGTSRGADAPSLPLPAGRNRLRININGDGYQEVDISGGVGTGTDQVANLNTAANIAGAIQFVVRQLTKRLASTNQNAFLRFQCTVDAGVLLLTSGVAGSSSSVNVAPASNSNQDTTGLLKLGRLEGGQEVLGAAAVLLLTSGVTGSSSSVNVAPASNSNQDATGLLNLGRLEGGQEILGAAVARPRSNPSGTSPGNYYLVGDHAAPTAEVLSVQAGTDGDPITTDIPYIDAFNILNNIEDVSLIAVPGIGSTAVVGAGMNYCANRPLSDCFFIGDMDVRDDTIEEAKTFRDAITPKNSYGAVYLPWLRMPDPTGISPEPILVPPSGYVAGLYAKTDAQRGVWKAPAGTAAALGGAVGLAVNFTDVQQGNLNPYNINAIRQFAGAGIVLWGARTVTSDQEWNYIPVRRMAIFLRVSIYRGIQWAVFEPNDEDLWAGLRLNIGSFMMTLFRQGAFQGEMPSKAFFVKCDGETTTQADIDLGIVNVLVGFAPLKPAEFVVVKISQMAGQSS